MGRRLMVSVLALLVASSACSTPFDALTRPDGLTGGSVSVVSSITVIVANPTLVVGGQTQGSATPKKASDQAVSDAVVPFESTLPAVATVSSTGVVNAVAPGTAIITASADKKTGTAMVTV